MKWLWQWWWDLKWFFIKDRLLAERKAQSDMFNAWARLEDDPGDRAAFDAAWGKVQGMVDEDIRRWDASGPHPLIGVK